MNTHLQKINVYNLIEEHQNKKESSETYELNGRIILCLSLSCFSQFGA
jgi:hypothetical protein